MYKDYFTLSKDKDTHFFDLQSSKLKAGLYKSSAEFGDLKHKVYVIDPFDGKRPLLLNYEFIVEEKALDIGFYHTLIMDSNVVSGLHEYLAYRRGQIRLNESMVDALESFLEHLCVTNIDYSSIFYLAENYYKEGKGAVLEHSSLRISSILQLFSINPEIFVNDKEIVIDQERKDYYFDLHNGGSFDQCGRNIAKWFVESHEPSMYDTWSNLTYACLLKMVLIKFKYKKEVDRKNEEMYQFMVTDIGAVLSWENALALSYFSGFVDKFIGVDKKTPLERAKYNLKRTSWDVLLLKMPYFLLNVNHLPEVTLGYVATSEKKLYEFGRNISLSLQMCRVGDSVPKPVVSFDLGEHAEKLGDVKARELGLSSLEIALDRLVGASEKAISPVDLKYLVRDLEHQLSFLCRS
ncbi:hypothetical protein [Agaribacterium sp. ZY112]|uniref:hypothetical protein n=1 Tax=Agaribacterium sp. ZY112 TaxID=3233574 RepID=UPI00352547E3